ncbi:Cullin-domain-containing protein [Polychaeton citri CBS 116435]|uniref:Cullin-domain-containing protein n=1 Tax=Polychaeton citri CBS 116435 TaxID=1314669 RepID=A0A9P4URB3_9PEZI|nr:Cullin-domain-containing protein [Polychaeton citri CBS 116435]
MRAYTDRNTSDQGLNNADLDFDKTWEILRNAFIEIHTKNASLLSFEELYRHAYKIVLKKKGEDLYNRVAQFEQEWLGRTVRTRIVGELHPVMLLRDQQSRTLSSASDRRDKGEKFLKALKESWEDHTICMSMLTDVLMYMDRVYCIDHRQPSIFAKSMGIFRDQILRNPVGKTSYDESPYNLLQVLTTVILDQIQMERDGDRIDVSMIKSNVYMLEGLYESEQEVEDEKLYLQEFEPQFLRSSADFYREEGERLLRESDAGTYCRQAKRRIEEEADRCRSTLSESTTQKIQKVVEDELIRNKMKGLIGMDSGVRFMVDNDKIFELSLVYELEARVDPRKSELTRAMQKIILEMGAAVNAAAINSPQTQTAPAQPSVDDDGGSTKEKKAPVKAANQQTVTALKWMEDVLALKDRFDTIWARAFNSDQMVHTALSSSIRDVINGFNRGSEFISLFIDDNMKKGIRDRTEAEVDATLEKAIVLLRFLQDRDLFERYYKKHLSKRLLLNKSQSMDVEKQMISRMKIELGNSFTQKLEAMFKDMSLSQELTNDYRTHVRNLGDASGAHRVDLSINVLTSMTWPQEAFRSSSQDDQNNQDNTLYPPQIAHLKQGFEQFYAKKYSGRRLTWCPNMGDADLKATFPKSTDKNGRSRTHDINCSTYAMLILLLFNDLPSGIKLTLEEIQARTNIPMNALTRNLQSLAVAPKTRFLVKEPMSRDVNPGDQFHFNESFKSQYVKIKVGVVSAGNKVEGDKERKETEDKNNETRMVIVSAAIVRIMKQRKELAHAQLITETITVLANQFKPDVSMIKKAIENLIEREYLERIESAPVPSYRYLA